MGVICLKANSTYCGLALLISCTIPAFFIKKGAWLQHRAQTLALWIMFVTTIPSFADRIAPVATTHNPKAFFTVSLLALIANAALAIYQFNKIRKNKLNPFKDEIFADSKAYKQVNIEIFYHGAIHAGGILITVRSPSAPWSISPTARRKSSLPESRTG
jgi:hypothetical protein